MAALQELRCSLAWVGDSSGLVVDMKTQGQHTVTTPHTPYTTAEKEQLLSLAKVNQALRQQQGKADVFKEVTEEQKQRRKEDKLKKITAKKAEEAGTAKKVSSEEEAKMRAQLAAAMAALAEAEADLDAAVENLEDAGSAELKSRRSEKDGDAAFEGLAGDGDAAEPDSETEEDVQGSMREAEEEMADDAMIAATFAQLGLEPSAAELALYSRAFRREKVIQKAFPRHAKYRRRCFIHQRAKEKDENQPLVVATDDDPFSKHHKDLMMSRSIGDWTKCVWVLPQPQMLHFRVAAGEHKRVIIASDGLWDIVTAEEAMAVARDTPSVDQVAEILMSKAKVEYLQNRNLPKMGDDTTVMVIDLNPSNMEFEPRTPGCCAIA